uniref:Uncharacterized protein n=1 Tax=Chromera velia CCMP2878 TaxID=1169474 RepID=A0A0G4GZT0_9ALVE|eukprot:Cvel_24029.t1-p1 / transcript=Cvel_24029.t1 / gene=Cvel_24029 / organism=Chromera_velia_CCMP2878 / gene_product=hypothetical protein / transcript_product=hypothetical protein / location=Cvel_scaffold2551:1455-12128(-) / protein_length=814 / sequence_SO=supercontig / SO=protein_coding / is_pseudo=false
MISIHRTPRFQPSFLGDDRVPPEIGPGTYDTERGRQITSPPQQLFGFASSTEKTIHQAPKLSNVVTPGPAQYSPRAISTAATDLPPEAEGLQVFKSRSPRFAPSAPGSSVFMASSLALSPGPGTYLEDHGPSNVCYTIHPHSTRAVTADYPNHSPRLLVPAKSPPSVPPNVNRKTNFPNSGTAPLPSEEDDAFARGRTQAFAKALSLHAVEEQDRQQALQQMQPHTGGHINIREGAPLLVGVVGGQRTGSEIESESDAGIGSGLAGCLHVRAFEWELSAEKEVETAGPDPWKHRPSSSGILGQDIPFPPAHLHKVPPPPRTAGPVEGLTARANRKFAPGKVLEPPPAQSVEANSPSKRGAGGTATVSKTGKASSLSKDSKEKSAGSSHFFKSRTGRNPTEKDPKVTSHTQATPSMGVAPSREPRQRKMKDPSPQPGPGAYTIAGTMNKATFSVRVHNHFGSLTARESLERDLEAPFTVPARAFNPGPGAYKVCGKAKDGRGERRPVPARRGDTRLYHFGVHAPTLVSALRANEGRPLHSFQTTDERDCRKSKATEVPGTGSYFMQIPPNNTMDFNLNERARVGRRGVFGSASPRFPPSGVFGKEGAQDDVPGPGSYSAGPPRQERNEALSVFASTKPRIPRMRAPFNKEPHVTFVGRHKSPGPAHYENDRRVNYRSPFKHSRKEHLSFGTGIEREPPGGVFGNEMMQRMQNPGPADYETDPSAVGLLSVRGVSQQRRDEIRFATNSGVPKESESPPVGAYDLRGDFTKRSFNSTLHAKIPIEDAKGHRWETYRQAYARAMQETMQHNSPSSSPD